MIEMFKDTNPTTAFFSDSVESFLVQYQDKACFRDRFKLFISGVKENVPPQGRILDFGCGPGVISTALGATGYEVLGVDGSSGMLQQARATATRMNLANVRFEQVDATQFEPPSGAFDAVVASSVIEYLPDDLGLLGKLAQSLRPGGLLLLSVPHDFHVFVPVEALQRSARGLFRRRGEHLLHTRHRYGRASLLKTLAELGFAEFKCTFFEFPLLGEMGTRLSRCRLLGRMLLVQARKTSS